MTDRKFMTKAIELARKGTGRVDPNPLVGAVIVKEDSIMAEGYHRAYGELHAERAALAALESFGGRAEGCDIYVTLEPCCHHGKQPPCTDAIIESGIRRVIVGSPDPNPLVAGKGIEILRNSGIEVIEDFMRDECDSLNPVFFHYISTGRPYVVMKYAMTMDGKTAAYTGESKWITGEEARYRVHQDRNKYYGIMTGIGTVLRDDPLLNCRIPEGRHPVRIICDSGLRTPTDSQIVKTADKYPTIIATCCKDEDRYRTYEDTGCKVITVPETEDGHVDLVQLMDILGREKIDSILLEGGSRLNWSALESGIVSKIQAYIAPKIFGGAGAPSPVSGQGVPSPDRAFRLSIPEISFTGQDILLESEVLGCSQE